MTAARRLAAILAAGVGVREHRDGTSENRANGRFPPRQSQSSHAKVLRDARRADGDKAKVGGGL